MDFCPVEHAFAVLTHPAKEPHEQKDKNPFNFVYFWKYAYKDSLFLLHKLVISSSNFIEILLERQYIKTKNDFPYLKVISRALVKETSN